MSGFVGGHAGMPFVRQMEGPACCILEMALRRLHLGTCWYALLATHGGASMLHFVKVFKRFARGDMLICPACDTWRGQHVAF